MSSPFLFTGGGGGGSTPTTDAFKSAVQAWTGDKVLWTASGATFGNLANEAVPFADEFGVEPGLKLAAGSTGNYKVRYGGPASDLTTRQVVRSDQRGTANYLVAESSLSFSPTAALLVFAPPDWQQWCELFAFDGTDGAPEPNSNELVCYFDQTAVGWNVSGGAGLAPVNHGRVPGWYTVAVYLDSGTTYVKLSRLNEAFAGVGSNSNATSWTPHAGFRLHRLGTGSGLTGDNMRIAAIAAASSATSAELEAAHDALSMQVPT